jgi:hypothetical protein
MNMDGYQARAVFDRYDILDNTSLRPSLRTVRSAFPRCGGRRPCAAKRTAYGMTEIGKALALFPSFDSTITFG